MFSKNRISFLVRFVLILTLLVGTLGVRNVQASPLGADGTVLVTVRDTDDTPMGGLNVYTFNGTTYTGVHGTTEQNGQVALQLPEGSYRFRADLNGTQFWSDAANHCDIPGCNNADITVSKPVTVTVLDTDGAPQTSLNVYAFNGSTYTGYNKTTNTDGQAVFTLPLGSYRFRADRNGTQFWSGTANHCDIPGCESAGVTVSKPMTMTVLDTDGAPKTGLNVYAFDGSTYTGYNKTTTSNGQAVFTLPLGSYRFRADLNGTQFWSSASNHCDIPGCNNASVIVSKPMTVTVLDTDGTPKAGLSVYAFNNSTYTGYNKTTNAAGQATFTLPLGSYRFRADLNGTQFWSDASNHCTLPGCESVQVTVTLPLTVIIQDGGGTPKSGVNVYAFNSSTYTGYSKVSDANGRAVFTLPAGNYRFRADYSGVQYWSGTTNHCNLPGCMDASVTVGPIMTATPSPTNTPTATATFTSTPTFTPMPSLFTISGNAGVAGAVLSYMENGTSKTVTAGSSGSYTIQVSPGWSGTVTPSKPNVSFSPASQTYTSLQTNMGLQNYIATIIVINTNSSGPGSFSQAVTEASSGATIRFNPSLAGRTITLSSSVIVDNKKLILDGSGLSPQITIDGGGTVDFILNRTSGMDIHDLIISNFNNPLRFHTNVSIQNSTLKNFEDAVIFSYGSLDIINSIFENNGGQAVIALAGSTVTISNSVLKNNAEGAIFGSSQSVIITNSILSGNGGDAINVSGPVTVNGSTVMDNQGRGIVANGAPLSLVNSTIYQNAAEAIVINGNSESTVVNSTIAKNQGNEGQILVNGRSDVDISNSIIVGTTNRVFFLNAGTLNLYNSILVCTHDNECFFSEQGTVNWFDSSVFPNATWEELGLGELADNGGPTPTMALWPDSFLIDGGDDTICAGSPVHNLDQRGVMRPQGAHCDIGAYEYDGNSTSRIPTITTLITSPDPSLSGQTVTATVTVSPIEGEAPTGSVVIAVDGSTVCTIILVNGTGVCNMVFNTMGTIPITATYNGNNEYRPSSDTVLHEVLAPPPTATYTPSPTLTPTPVITPTIFSTPVFGCNIIRDTIQATANPIKFAARTMYLDIPNANPYQVTINSVYAAWNYDKGHIGSNTNLKLLNVKLGSTIIWESSTGIHQPNYTISSFSNPAVIPANATTRLTFTFDQTYNRMSDEQIQLQFSTPGCESYPVAVPAGAPTVTPVPGANLKVQLISGGTDNNLGTTFHYRVQNTGTSPVSNITVRIYFTTDDLNPSSSYVLEKYYDQSGAATITGPTLASGNTYYFTVNYGTASLSAGSSWEFDTSLHLNNWATTYNGANDWWHTTGALPVDWTDWNNIMAYVNGSRVWGVLP